MLFEDEEIVKLFDKMIYLQVDTDEMFQRRMARFDEPHYYHLENEEPSEDWKERYFNEVVKIEAPKYSTCRNYQVHFIDAKLTQEEILEESLKYILDL
ncbi:hypothetical protein M0811_11352 [Anaeramoeba ignava]|uniref:Uncharacterized protein n=1 Tax=Anaeramoeba ignava TaxID=1746090 RepID=A0A9Q0R7D3_ANAIG|nr:hypothetical protein M0811_11352 [Anaeramoeba ignava]